MQTKDIKQKVILPCTPQEAYDAWLDSKTHSEIIGADAAIDPKVGGKFSLWDGEMLGKTIEIHPPINKIVQEWRDNGSDWPEEYYSTITLVFHPLKNGKTELVFTHTGIPQEHVKDIEEGWNNFYWKPMQKYFEAKKK